MTEERRGEPRYIVIVEGGLRNASGSAQPVEIFNLSASGCRFRSTRQLAEGDFLTLKVGPVGALDAKVVWREDDNHGVQFEQPLHPAVLDHVRLFLSENPALYVEGEGSEGDEAP